MSADAPAPADVPGSTVPRNGIRGRISATALDQAVAGGSNVLIEIVAARELDAAGFGLFALFVLVYAVASQLLRSVVGDPLLIHPDDARTGTQGPTGLVVALALVVAGILGGAAGVAHLHGNGPGAGALAALAVSFPLLALQDFGRYVAFARGRPGGALRLDVGWLAVMLVGLGALYGTGTTPTLPAITLVWAGSGAVAGLPVLRLLRGGTLSQSVRWLSGVWTFSWRYVLSFLATQGSVLLASFALTWIAGASAIGAVRGVQLLIRPFMTLHVAAVASTVSSIADASTAPAQVRGLARRISGTLLVLSSANCLVLLLLPDALGELLLGPTWHHARALIAPACLQVTLFAVWTGARVGLIGLKQVRTTVALDVAFIPVTFLVAIIGALWDGARGFYWGGVVLQGGITAAWWYFLRRRTPRSEHGPRHRTSTTST